MSTAVQSSLANLKASTAQLVGIIASAQHIPAGSVDVHLALTKQVTTLLADIIRAHEKGDYIPVTMASCSKELMRVCAWEALGDNSCDLLVVPNPSTGPLTVNLPSPPVLPSPPLIASSSGTTTSESRREQQEEVPMISGHPSQSPKSAMKGSKQVKSTRFSKSKPFVESEDDEDPIVQPILRGVLEVVLPQLSTIVIRKPQLLQSPPRSNHLGLLHHPEVTVSHLDMSGTHMYHLHLCPLHEKPSISRPEARATSGSRLEVEESSDDTSSALDGDPPANTTFDIIIPSSNNPCHACVKEDWPCTTRLDKRSGHPCLSCIRCSTKKIKCIPASLGSLAKCTRGKSTTGQTHSKTPACAPSNAPSPSQSRTQTHS
ncbi:hypothetical protein C8R48DRAFT_772444 [Suillus tomentosus]|nr:hypothetical protein C8R48DRAFT_772444 [Suillus tomentosus]